MTIGREMLRGCKALESISFNGTVAQWELVTKNSDWNRDVPATVIKCTDGDVSIK